MGLKLSFALTVFLVSHLVSYLVSHSVSHAAFSNTLPNPQLTPGSLCTPADPDFKGFEYPTQVARCNRNTTDQDKVTVADSYGGIPRSDWINYEFDHYMPLCAGGSNSQQNLWPQPISEAKQKDIIELQVCNGLRSGTLNQEQALQKIRDWFLQFASNTNAENPVIKNSFSGSTGL